MRAEKKSIVQEIKQLLEGRSMFILMDHTGLNANQMNELRLLLRKAGSEYLIVKNRLLKKALAGDVFEKLEPTLTGPTGVAVSGPDSAALSKAVIGFAKKNEAPNVKGGYLDGVVLNAEQIKAFAALPSREVMLGRFMGTIQAPLTSFIRGLAELPRRFVYIIDQVSKRG